jgi:hypothetical protein
MDALREPLDPSSAPTPSAPGSSTPSAAANKKRHRPEDVEGKEEARVAPVPRTASPSSSSPSASSSPLASSSSSPSTSSVMEEDDVDASEHEVKEMAPPSTTSPGPAATGPSQPATPPSAKAVQSAAQSTPQTLSFVPARTRRETLAARVNIDSRMDDVLVVEVQVHPNYPDAPTISRVQYQSNDEAKRKCAVAFVGSKTGLDMKAPTVPLYLLQKGQALAAAITTLTPEQTEWHNTLSSLARQCSDVVRDQTGDADARADACERLWEHLDRATLSAADSPPALWNHPSLLVSTWDALLPTGTCILSDQRPASTGSPAILRRSYRLRLQGANPQLTHVLACAFSSYALLRQVQPDITTAWDKLLGGDVKESIPDSTDSSASDDSDGWEQSVQAKKRDQQKQRRARSLPKRMAEFKRSHLTAADVSVRFAADTGLPLLALSAQLKMRAWEHKYISCLVDNFQSIGCDTLNLKDDPIFQKVTTSKPELMPPFAAWSVNQYNGGADVSIFIREDNKQELLRLNDYVRELLSVPQSELRLKCTVFQSGPRDRTIPRTHHTVFLNQVVPVVRPAPTARREPLIGTTTAAPPAPGTWAAAVLHAVQRLPASDTLNHRPKKRKSGGGNGAGASPKTPSRDQPVRQAAQSSSPPLSARQQGQQQQPQQQQHAQPHRQQSPVHPAKDEFDSRFAALEQRLHQIETTATQRLHRALTNVEALTNRFDEHAKQLTRVVEQLERVSSTLNLVCAHLRLSPPLPPTTVVPPSVGVPTTLTPSAATFSPQLMQRSLQPSSDMMTEDSAVDSSDTLLQASGSTSRSSASAHPARMNGSAVCNG